MTAYDMARLQAAGRAVLGAALALAPALVTRGWIGRTATEPGTRVAVTAMGARDLALAAGGLNALRSGAPAAPWIAAGAAADAADLIATLRAREDLPTPGVIGVSALAAGSAALGAWLTRELR